MLKNLLRSGLVRQIMTGTDRTGAEAMSDATLSLRAPRMKRKYAFHLPILRCRLRPARSSQERKAGVHRRRSGVAYFAGTFCPKGAPASNSSPIQSR